MRPSGAGGGLAADLADYLDHLTQGRGLAANSVAAYRRDLERYCDYCALNGVRRTRDIRPGDVRGFLAHLAAGDLRHRPLSPTSAARSLAAVRGFHKYAASAGWADGDPAAAVHPPTATKRAPASLSQVDVAALMAAAGGPGSSPLGLRDRALLELLYASGARISEAVGLDTVALDLDAGRVVLSSGGRAREIPVGARAVAATADYLEAGRPVLAGAEQPALFVNARGGRLSRQSAWTVLQSAADRARLDDPVSPHTLRHSFAAHLIAGGAPPEAVEILLGNPAAIGRAEFDALDLRIAYLSAHPRA